MQVQKQKQGQRQNAGVLRCAQNDKQKRKQRRRGWSSAGDPTHRKLRDGWGTRAFVLVVWLWRTGNGKCASKIGCCHSVSANSLCLPLRGSLNYLDAFFFFAAVFFVVFFAAFFVDFFVATAEPPGLTTPISFVPMGEPRPVQASQPGPALKPTGVPV